MIGFATFSVFALTAHWLENNADGDTFLSTVSFFLTMIFSVMAGLFLLLQFTA